MALWNRRDEADALEELAVGAPLQEAPRGDGFGMAPVGVLAAVLIVVLLLAVFGFGRGFGPGWRDDWRDGPSDDTASERLVNIEAEQRLADARAWSWRDRDTVDAHVSSFAVQTPPR